LLLKEPAWASIEPAAGREVHGVVIRLKEEEYAKLWKSEGANFYPQPYVQYKVRAVTYADGRVIEAIAFRSNPEANPSGRELAPSQRYRSIILSGAVKAGLNQKYIFGELETIPKIPVPNELHKRVCLAFYGVTRKLGEEGGEHLKKFFRSLVFVVHDSEMKSLSTCHGISIRAQTLWDTRMVVLFSVLWALSRSLLELFKGVSILRRAVPFNLKNKRQ